MKFQFSVQAKSIGLILFLSPNAILCADGIDEVVTKFNTEMEKANARDPIACFNVASMLESGANGPRDQNKALSYYELSGELGYPIAWFRYGNLIERLKSKTEAEKYYILSSSEMEKRISNAQELTPEEMYYIGEMHAIGSGTFKKDYSDAATWWAKSKELGSESSAYQLAITELIAPQNESSRKNALESLCLLAQRGHPLSIALSNSLVEGTPARLRQTLAFTDAENIKIRKAVQNGLDVLVSVDYLDDRFKTFYVADFVWSGIGFERNEADAIATWKRSLELGNFMAADILIALHLGLFGEGEHISIEDAEKYLEFRIKWGDVHSKAVLNDILAGGNPNSDVLRPINETLKKVFAERP